MLEKHCNMTFKSSLQDLNKSSLSPPNKTKISCFKKSQDHILTDSEDFETKEGHISSNKYDLTPKLIDNIEMDWENSIKVYQKRRKLFFVRSNYFFFINAKKKII